MTRGEGVHLNASQRRSVEALLESLDSMLLQVERLIPEAQSSDAVVTVVANDLPEHFTAYAPARIAALRDNMQELAHRIHVTKRRISKKRVLRGMLSAQMVRVEDITPARLRSYGDVHESFGEQVTPALQHIRRGLAELLEMLQD
jgi:hypothetical protein